MSKSFHIRGSLFPAGPPRSSIPVAFEIGVIGRIGILQHPCAYPKFNLFGHVQCPFVLSLVINAIFNLVKLEEHTTSFFMLQHPCACLEANVEHVVYSISAVLSFIIIIIIINTIYNYEAATFLLRHHYHNTTRLFSSTFDFYPIKQKNALLVR